MLKILPDVANFQVDYTFNHSFSPSILKIIGIIASKALLC